MKTLERRIEATLQHEAARLPNIEQARLFNLRHPDRPKPRRTLAIAVASFMGTLLLGTVAWLIASPGSEPADGNPLDRFVWDLAIRLPAPENSTQFLTALEATPGVASIVEYFPDQAVLYPSQASDTPTSSGTETTVVGLPDELESRATAIVLVTIDDLTAASDVANRIGSTFDIYQMTFSRAIASIKADEFWDQMSAGAEELDDDPVFLQPPPGPEPLFDTTGLGEEIVLLPAKPEDSVPDFVLQSTKSPVPGRSVADFEGPVVNIGTVAEINATMLLFGTSDGGYCRAVIEGNGWGSGCGDFTKETFGVTGWGGNVGQTGYAEVRVPIETAVVQFSIDGGAPSWQRQVAGFALFPITVEDYGSTFHVTAFGESGDVIGEWETTS